MTFGEVSYSYDAGGRPARMESSLCGFEFGYDTLGRRTSLAYPNGTQTTYRYDNAGNLAGLVAGNGGETISGFSYTHDRVGNRLSKRAANDQEHKLVRYDYSYDGIYRLLESMPVGVKKHRGKNDQGTNWGQTTVYEVGLLKRCLNRS